MNIIYNIHRYYLLKYNILFLQDLKKAEDSKRIKQKVSYIKESLYG